MDYTKEKFLEDWIHFLDCVSFKDSAMDKEAIMFLIDAPAKICEALELAQANK